MFNRLTSFVVVNMAICQGVHLCRHFSPRAHPPLVVILCVASFPFCLLCSRASHILNKNAANFPSMRMISAPVLKPGAHITNPLSEEECGRSDGERRCAPYTTSNAHSRMSFRLCRECVSESRLCQSLAQCNRTRPKCVTDSMSS